MLGLEGLFCLWFIQLGLTGIIEARRPQAGAEVRESCAVRSSAPPPLPPGQPGEVSRRFTISLGFPAVEGSTARAVECSFEPSSTLPIGSTAPLKITYDPWVVGIRPARPGGAVDCTVGRPPAAEAAALTFVNDVGARLETAVICPGGAAPDRAMRIGYDPRAVGISSRGDFFPHVTDSFDDVLVLAFGGMLLGFFTWAWFWTRTVYEVDVAAVRSSGQEAPPDDDGVPRRDGTQPEPGTRQGEAASVGPSGLETALHAFVVGVVVAGGVAVLVGIVIDLGLVTGMVLAAIAVVLVLLVRWLLGRDGPDDRGITISDDALTLVLRGGGTRVLARGATGLIGIHTMSTKVAYFVDEINVWSPDGQLLGSWSPGWPFGRSARVLRQVFRRHGWPHATQNSRFPGVLFGVDPGGSPRS